MHTLLVIGCFVIVALAGIYLGFALPVRRSRRLEQKARELGFRYSAQATPFQDSAVQGLTVLPVGSLTEVDNLLERSNGCCRFFIGDIGDVWQETMPLITTVAAFRVSAIHLPVFEIEEMNVIQRVIEQAEHALGKKLANFDTDQRFGSNFFVHCPDKNAVQSFLTPAKLAYLRDHAAHYHVESSSDWLLIYRPGFEVPAEEIKEFSEITSEMASVLLSVQKSEFPTAA
jgi:hypothetical protein